MWPPISDLKVRRGIMAALAALGVVGSNDTALLADSTQPSGVRWGPVALNQGVRQTVLSGDVDASGYGDCVGIGSGLACNLKAASSNAIMSFANGFSESGSVDYIKSVPAQTAYWASLVANNRTFLAADYVDRDTVPTAKKYLIPPQYGQAFDRAKGALLRFQAADASIAMIDDHGNSWTAFGNAQIDTAQFKWGTSSLLLDGTGDYISTTGIGSLGEDSWEIPIWVRYAALPTAGNRMALVHAYGGASFGFLAYLYNNAGTIRLELYYSSNGSSWNVLSGVVGTYTAWAINTWYRIRLAFDAVSGTMRAYLSINGAAESQDYTASTTERVCPIVTVLLGNNATVTAGTNGWIGSFGINRCVTINGTETPSAVMPSITDHPINWFDTVGMKMYEVTAPSGAAGVNPTLTRVNRLFIGEAVTGAATVSSVITYAYQGRYFGETAGVAVDTQFIFNHNIGVPREHLDVEIFARGLLTAISQQWTPMQSYSAASTNAFAPEGDQTATTLYNKRRTIRGQTSDGGALVHASSVTTAANYKLALRARRSF